MSEFDYINRTYGLSLRKGSAVETDGVRGKVKRGRVIRADGAYIYIQWDDEEKPRGPYHPTSELVHLDGGAA